MKLELRKIVTFLLLTAFLVVNLGSLFGCFYCDSGYLSDVHVSSHADKNVTGNTAFPVAPHNVVCDVSRTITVGQSFRQAGDLCFDSPFRLAYGLAEKIKTVKSPPAASIHPPRHGSTDITAAGLLLGHVFRKPLPRISQAILVHRTVVLLS